MSYNKNTNKYTKEIFDMIGNWVEGYEDSFINVNDSLVWELGKSDKINLGTESVVYSIEFGGEDNIGLMFSYFVKVLYSKESSEIKFNVICGESHSGDVSKESVGVFDKGTYKLLLREVFKNVKKTYKKAVITCS